MPTYLLNPTPFARDTIKLQYLTRSVATGITLLSAEKQIADILNSVLEAQSWCLYRQAQLSQEKLIHQILWLLTQYLEIYQVPHILPIT